MIAANFLIFGRKYANYLIGKYLLQTNVLDTSGRGNNGTGTGIDYTTFGGFNSVRFDSVNDYIDIADSDDFSFTNGGGVDVPFSISVWVYPTGFSSSGNWVISKRGAAVSDNEYQCYFKSNQIEFNKFCNNSGTLAYQGLRVDGFTIPTNTWTHLVFTDDGTKTNAGMKIYLNGYAPAGRINLNSGAYLGMANSTMNPRIGKLVTEVSTVHKGGMNKLEIWKGKELSASEVLAIYNESH